MSRLRLTNRTPRPQHDGGASAVEYAILIAAISAVIIGVVFTLGSKVRSTFEATSTCMTAKGVSCPAATTAPTASASPTTATPTPAPTTAAPAPSSSSTSGSGNNGNGNSNGNGSGNGKDNKGSGNGWGWGNGNDD
jgi:pilus assembly protein Flp/PilA